MKRCLGTGLIILLPLVLTFWIISFFVEVLTDPFVGIAQTILNTVGLKNAPTFFVQVASQILVLAFLFIGIVSIGAVTRYFFFNSLVSLGDSILHKIPVISGVYKTSQELIKTIMSPDAKAFKKVALVPFPHEGVWSIGFITREDDVLDNRVSVFVPTTPNPTSGFLILFEKDKILHIDMKVEEALRYVVSCGVLSEPPKILRDQV